MAAHVNKFALQVQILRNKLLALNTDKYSVFSDIFIQNHCKLFCSKSFTNSKDEVPGFTDKNVQNLLKRMTGMQLEKIFKASSGKLEPPTYKLLTEEKLQEFRETAMKDAEERLQMPPVMKERKEIDVVLAKNNEMRGLETSKYMFTDITVGVNDRDRFIVVREPDGTLRKATWEERDRLTQVYFPREGRKLVPPPLFEEQNLQNYFKDDRHEELLDLLCVQFEPDDSQFIQVHQSVYRDIENTWKYDVLRSTRHFGGMAYHFTMNKRIDGLLTDMIERDLINDAIDLVYLFHLLHPECSSVKQVKEKSLTGIDIIKAYLSLDSSHPGKAELALQAYENVSLETSKQEEN